MRPKILIIEDESAIREMLRFALQHEEFKIYEAQDSRQAELILDTVTPSIIILDWMLPGSSGLDFLEWLRKTPPYQDIPVIMLTAKAEETNKIMGLEKGADDYITKPFSTGELIARIKTIVRRGPLVTQNGLVQFKDLIININQKQVKISEEILELTPGLYRLLLFFLTHRNRTYSREQLLNSVWEQGWEVDERTVDTFVRRLRDKLRPFGYADYLETVRGEGYKFNAD